MELFYFGDPARRLFGSSETARIVSDNPRAVVLCYPMGQEQIWTHRAFRSLSVRLAKVGWHVLRFDYYGCGDSAGASGDGDVVQWKNDVVTAIEKAKTAFELERVSLVGLRLGATLATLIASQRNDIDQLVLWDPILEGRGYLGELSACHQEWLERRAEAGWELPSRDDEVPQVLGFPLTSAIRDSLKDINLLELSERPAPKILMINADDNEDARSFESNLRFLDCDVEHSCQPEAKIWLHVTMDQKIMPTQTMAKIVGWLDGKNV